MQVHPTGAGVRCVLVAVPGRGHHCAIAFENSDL